MKLATLITVLCLLIAFLIASCTPADAPRAFKLELAATTMTQIVVQWQNEPADTESFQLERATDAAFTENVKSYPLEKGTFLFSDTDREPLSKKRFVGDRGAPLLDPDTTYYYRVQAIVSDESDEVSNVVEARVSGPVRGVEGDLWADVVIGKRDFAQNVFGKPTKHGTFFAGGVLIDKRVKPNRMYIADCNNNRILGFKTTSPKHGADIVLGQPDFDSSAGNGDSCAQTFPYRGPAGPATLCLTLPTQISMGETVVGVNMAMDEEGSLYVPDVFNNRILKYKDPFGTDTVADQVWGQPDFAANEANRGNANPSNDSFRYYDYHRGAIAFDADSNMWVVDTGNHRVLRFPKDKRTAVIASKADIVLGQQSFETRIDGGRERTLAQMWYPRDLEFDADGRLYVSDGINNVYDGRLIVFDPPFSSGMAATKMIPVPKELDRAFGPGTVIISFARDVQPGRMWLQKSSFTTELIDLKTWKSVTSVSYSQASGTDVDSDGNIYIVSKWYGIYRYPASSWSLPPAERQKQVELVFPASNTMAADTTGGLRGITTFGDQLIIAETSRMLIWNDYDLDKLRNAHPADDVYGEDDFSTITYRSWFMSPQADSSRRLWVCRRISRGHHVLEAFDYPLKHDSTPVKSIPIVRGEEDVLPVRGGGTTRAAVSDFMDFAVVGPGDKIWVADRDKSRVFRINNIDGRQDSSTGPYVDIVLGQQDIAGDKGGPVGPQTLARSYNVGIGPGGELYITDNGGEVGSNRRILVYDKKRFPDNPATVLFNKDIGDPDHVIGTGGRFDITGLGGNDPICCPFELGIHPRGPIVAGMNGYSAQRFPLVYLDPLNNTLPQLALGDFTSYPTACFIDADGNVYIGDFDWYRVLIYKKPFKNLRY